MFIDAAGQPAPYIDPWTASLEERLRMLEARERSIAYFYEKPDAHTFRYRVFNMVQALDAEPDLGVSAAWFTREDLEATLHFIDRADALVICRTRYDAKIGQLIARARARGLPVLCDIDDLIFDLRYAHVIGDAIDRSLGTSEEWDWWCGYIGRLGLTLQLCDGAITTNPFLGGRISDFAPHLAATVIPNFLNKAQVTVSRAIYHRKLSGGFKRDGKVTVGYFSGTNTHNKDFRVAAGALNGLLTRNKKVVLHIVGSLDLPDQIARHHDRVRSYPLQDFVNLQRLQGEVEVSIVPVRDSVFANCKSELKYFEAAVVGTLVVASPVWTLREAISDGTNGFLCRSHEWDVKLESVLALLDGDASEYQRIVSRAFAQAEQRYGWDRQGALVVAGIFDHPASSGRLQSRKVRLPVDT